MLRTLIAGFSLILAILVGFLLQGGDFVLAETAEEPQNSGNGIKREEIERQIEQLEEEAAELDGHLQTIGNEKRTLTREKEQFDTEIRRRQVEIRRLALAIKKAALDIENKSTDIEDFSAKIEASRKALAAGLFLLYAYGEENALTILLKYKTLSGFFTSLHNLDKAKDQVHTSLLNLKELKSTREREREELGIFRKEQQELQSLQEVERRLLAQKKKEKEELIRLTQGKEALFQQLLKSKKRDIATLKTQLFYLEKTGITAEDAVAVAELAAKRAGIRPAFLLALLEVETGKQFEDGVISVGTNLGTGNWERDLYQCYRSLGKRAVAEAEKRAFFEITGKLNLDPAGMPVSRRPSYGCGGAMGPAQFLPTTWLRFEQSVAALTGHNPPNPWSVEDAFTAAAVFLAEAGATAQTPNGEMRAAKTYISGSPNCSRYICRFYSSRILTLAKDIDRIL